MAKRRRTKSRSRRKGRSVKSRSRRRSKTSKKKSMRLKKAGQKRSNRQIRDAINTVSGYVHGSGRTSSHHAHEAVKLLASSDLLDSVGRRGGVTRGMRSPASD